MKKRSFKDDYTNTVELKGSRTEWTLEKTATIVAMDAGDDGIRESDQRHGNRLIVAGDITVSSVVLELSGTETEIIIKKSAELRASHGAALNGINQDLTNDGTIVAVGTGVILSGTGYIVHNNNHIEGGVYGFLVRASASGQIINARDAVIQGGSVGIYLETGTGQTSTTINHGTIEGVESWGYQGGNGNDRLVNDGAILGGIYMGFGDDTADMRGTKGSATVFGSNGNDTLITDSATIKLFEFGAGDSGYDMVQSTVTYTLGANVEHLVLLGTKNIDATGNATGAVLVGNAGDNTITGLGGLDVLSGGRGDDSLFGGDGTDTFRFGTGWGHDVIEDYQPWTDVIGLLIWKAIKNYDDLMDNHISEKNGDVIIKAGHDSLTIRDTTLADLPESSFYF